jgi:hypothetical protein
MENILQQVGRWFNKQKELRKVKAEEMEQRKLLYAHFFPNPEEGTNTAPLDGEWVIKGGRKISREIDPGELQARGEALAAAGLPLVNLVEWKPSLKLKEYRNLTDEQRTLFDFVLLIKDGSPSLEVAIPAKARPKGNVDEVPASAGYDDEMQNYDAAVDAVSAQIDYFAKFPELARLGLMEPADAFAQVTRWDVTMATYGPLYDIAQGVKLACIQTLRSDFGGLTIESM